MQKTPLVQKIERAIEPTAQGMGYELVRVLMLGEGSGRPTLQIMAEKADGSMGVEDCENLSQAVSALLDVEDVIGEAYYLEVSSPGIDRPLTRLKDFDKYKDKSVRIEVAYAVNNQRKFKGILRGTEKDNILLETETGPVSIPFASLEKAKLVLSDDLIREVTHEDNKKKKAERKAARTERREKRKQKN